MYWEVGKYLSDLCDGASFGDKVIDEIAAYISDATKNTIINTIAVISVVVGYI